MPIYDYKCVGCGGREQRLAGWDDHLAICAQCGSLMLCDEEVFWPYFEEFSTLPAGESVGQDCQLIMMPLKKKR